MTMTASNALPILALILSMLAPSWLLAREGDSDQPIEVEADSLEIRELDNISIYRGNVRLRQGSLEIDSDELVIRFNDARELEVMEMSGAPARLRQMDDESKEMLGLAKRIDYTESKNLLVLIGGARFTHDGDVIESELIRINTETDAIEAGVPDSKERVKMRILPRNGGKPPQAVDSQ